MLEYLAGKPSQLLARLPHFLSHEWASHRDEAIATVTRLATTTPFDVLIAQSGKAPLAGGDKTLLDNAIASDVAPRSWAESIIWGPLGSMRYGIAGLGKPRKRNSGVCACVRVCVCVCVVCTHKWVGMFKDLDHPLGYLCKVMVQG